MREELITIRLFATIRNFGMKQFGKNECYTGIAVLSIGSFGYLTDRSCYFNGMHYDHN